MIVAAGIVFVSEAEYRDWLAQTRES